MWLLPAPVKGAVTYFDQTVTTNGNQSYTTPFDPLDGEPVNRMNQSYAYCRDALFTFGEGQNYSQVTGHYPAAYSFTNDEVGSVPDGWELWNPAYGVGSGITDFAGHAKVFKIAKQSSVAIPEAVLYTTSSGNIVTVEFWMGVETANSIAGFIVQAGAYSSICSMYFTTGGNRLNWYYSGTNAYIGNYVPGQMYHFKFELNFDSDQWRGSVDGVVLLDWNNFQNDLDASSLTRIRVQSYQDYTTTYIDAVDFSWSENYTVGRNMIDQGTVETVATTDTLDGVSYAPTWNLNVTNKVLKHQVYSDVTPLDLDGITYQVCASPLDVVVNVNNGSLMVVCSETSKSCTMFTSGGSIPILAFDLGVFDSTPSKVLQITLGASNCYMKVLNNVSSSSSYAIATPSGLTPLTSINYFNITDYFNSSNPVLLKAISSNKELPWGKLANNQSIAFGNPNQIIDNGTGMILPRQVWHPAGIYDTFTAINYTSQTAINYDDILGMSIPGGTTYESTPVYFPDEKLQGIIEEDLYNYSKSGGVTLTDVGDTNTTVNWTIGFWVQTTEAFDLYFWGSGVAYNPASNSFAAKVSGNGDYYTLDWETTGTSLAYTTENNVTNMPVLIIIGFEIVAGTEYAYFGLWDGATLFHHYSALGVMAAITTGPNFELYIDDWAIASSGLIVNEGPSDIFGPTLVGNMNVDPRITGLEVTNGYWRPYRLAEPDYPPWYNTTTLTVTYSLPINFPGIYDIPGYIIYFATLVNASVLATAELENIAGNHSDTTYQYWYSSRNSTTRDMVEFNATDMMDIYPGVIHIGDWDLVQYFTWEWEYWNTTGTMDISVTTSYELTLYALPIETTDFQMLDYIMPMVPQLILIAIFPALLWVITKKKLWAALGFPLWGIVGMVTGLLDVGMAIIVIALGLMLSGVMYKQEYQKDREDVI